MNHPCLRCGACCATYLVAMYWSEADSLGIDPALTQQLDPLRVSMRVDPVDRSRCIALAGKIGVAAHCQIYSQRPWPCREVGASWEDGRASDQCDRARLRHGLPLLTPADWVPAPQGLPMILAESLLAESTAAPVDREPPSYEGYC